MNWFEALGITVIVVFIFLYEWPKINRNQKNEKTAFAVLLFLGWGLGALLVFFPDLPGPTQVVDSIFRPLGKLLE